MHPAPSASGALGVGSLVRWAREDSPEGYADLLKQDVAAAVRTCSGTHNAVARVAAKLLNGLHVCVTSNAKTWFAFDGVRWREDADAVGVRHRLSTTVRRIFLDAVSEMAEKAAADDIRSMSSMLSGGLRGRRGEESGGGIRDAMRELLLISNKLEDGPFKDQVVRRMREYMLDLHFVDKLDSLPNLVAFDNGVWDLDAGGFRDAGPEDLICKSVGYSYTDRDDPRAEAAVRDYWDVMHPDADQRAYVLRTFSRQLYGDRGHELFHVHSGHLASASNGKTGFFEAFQAAAGEYVCKFGV
jgi:phage/plasmid-associated DNA primase